MKKVISFSLWGDDERYTHGALHNIELAKKVYPDWICRFYIGTSVPPHIVKQIEEADNTEVIKMSEEGDWTGMFWRFYAAGDPQVDVMISRDCDSRLWYREKAAVGEWLAGDKDFHIMRDHPTNHHIHILGGMWGARNGVVSDINKLSSKYKKGDFWQVDQNFLRDIIYPIIKNNSCVHDDFDNFNDVCEKKPFPYDRDPAHFVGRAYMCGYDRSIQQFIESNFANDLNDTIKQHVQRTLSQKEMPDLPDNLIQTDSLGEVVEKLVILHIRMWMLEDASAEATTDSELADIKRKIDICFKKKRPMFVEAINKLIDLAITENKSLEEDSVKLYRDRKK